VTCPAPIGTSISTIPTAIKTNSTTGSNRSVGTASPNRRRCTTASSRKVRRCRKPATYDVDGILLERPFKVVKLGPVNLFVEDLEKAESFYRDTLGFILTEEVRYAGHRVVYLRNNTEHHSLALYPIALRSVLGLRADTTTMAIGMQLANYQQLRNALTFFRSRGVELRELPPELTPGMDHTMLAIDPDGHAVQLYWSMEQIGWDGRPRPAELRRTIVPGSWPDELDANSDSYTGEPLLGPWS
jgi:catechol 2,3-dioxygenase-like lactoylglutathione lyase family enzyme